MRNIKLTVEYDGTNYSGWQFQKSNFKNKKSKIRTVQAEIENTLNRILQEKVNLIASGRTDAGVHALAQIANFKTSSEMPLEKMHRALNCLLPSDIAITNIKETDLDFHSRFNAKWKIYRYTLLNRQYPSAALRNRAYFYAHPLDITLMRKQANSLLGRHDFSSFQASGDKNKDTVRTIKRINITKQKDLIYIDIEANGFLHNMVRNIVGTLIKIGRGEPTDIKKLLFLKDRRKAGPTAPARGLCLIRVSYK